MVDCTTMANSHHPMAIGARMYLIRSILAPIAIGWWEFAIVVQSTISAFDPGLESAAGVELPVLHGKGDVAEQSCVQSTVWVTHVVLGATLTGAVVGYALWRKPSMSPAQFL